MKIDWEELDANSGIKPEKTPVTIKKEVPQQLEVKVREHSEIKDVDEEQFAEYDELESAWLLSVKKIIGDEHYPRYLELREENEKEKMIAYKEYHDYLRKKFGDKF
jgi:hypothetical protein